MAWELSADVEQFAGTAGEFLRSRPVQHTTLLTVIDAVRRRGTHVYGPDDPVFGWWRTDAGTVDGVLVHTPPYPMGFSALPPEARAGAVDVIADRRPTAVNLRSADADFFADTWVRRTGAKPAVQMQTRLYRLDELTPPAPPPGAARIAGAADRELLLRWTDEFHHAIGTPAGPPQVDEWIEHGLTSLWAVGGVPVAMANRSLPDAGMVRIRAVYTPADRRGRGYGGAVTVAATRAALATGVPEVVLFTDQANPTSNGLYTRLGYRPVEDRTVVEVPW
jgi:GNAT superfamily N-acetyltransferase